MMIAKKTGSTAAVISAAILCTALCTGSNGHPGPAGTSGPETLGLSVFASEDLEPGEVSQYALEPDEYYYMWNEETFKKRTGNEDDGFPGTYVKVNNVYEDSLWYFWSTRKAEISICKFQVETKVECEDYKFFPAPSPDELIAGY
ncbi:MAG: hypothetical protein HUJ54_13180 [Erysipelotrichaceae bacterium]|nr:hypothetical protein [Erysipelotrichaceae bacterium]